MRKHARTAGGDDRADSSSLTAEAYGIVRHRILSGELHLGQPIARRTIAQELGMNPDQIDRRLTITDLMAA